MYKGVPTLLTDLTKMSSTTCKAERVCDKNLHYDVETACLLYNMTKTRNLTRISSVCKQSKQCGYADVH